MLDFELDPTDRALLEEFRHFALKVLRPYAGQADASSDIPAALLNQAETLNCMRAYLSLEMGGGWRSLAHPAQVYDVAGSMKRRVMLNEEGGYGDAALFLAMPGPALTEPLVRVYGNPEQQRRCFEIFLRDQPRWSAFAMSEPDAGSDVAAIQTTATKKAGGYVINGRKWFIGNGARADWVTVFATIGRERGQFGVKVFLIDRDTPGFRAARVLQTMGLKALQVSELIFEDCEIPDENVLVLKSPRKGEAGIQGALKTFSVFRPSVSATAMGVARAALESCEQFMVENGATHVGARRWRAARERLAYLRSEMQVVRRLFWQAAALYDQGKDNNLEASMAKALSADVALKICVETMDLAGKASATNELPLERLFRDIMAFYMLEGTGDIHRLMVAKALGKRSQ